MQTRSGRNRKLVHDDFDGAWKNMITEQRFSDFIAFFMPDLHPLIDWTRGVEFLEQELRAITRKTKRGQGAVDRLVKVWLRDGSERWVLIHAEVQSQFEADFRFRMFRYCFRTLDLFDGHPIICLAILGDSRPDWKPQGYDYALWGTSIEFRFRVVKLLEYSDHLEELVRNSNPFARFTVAHLKTVQTQGDYETRLQWKLRIIQGLYDMTVPEAEIGQLCHDFDWLLALPERIATRFYQEMVRFEEERTMPHLSTAERIGRREGRKEGRKEGREEEARALLLLQGRARFGEPDEGAQTALAAITEIETLERLAIRLLEANNWQELLQP